MSSCANVCFSTRSSRDRWDAPELPGWSQSAPTNRSILAIERRGNPLRSAISAAGWTSSTPAASPAPCSRILRLPGPLSGHSYNTMSGVLCRSYASARGGRNVLDLDPRLDNALAASENAPQDQLVPFLPELPVLQQQTPQTFVVRGLEREGHRATRSRRRCVRRARLGRGGRAGAVCRRRGGRRVERGPRRGSRHGGGAQDGNLHIRSFARTMG